MKGETPMRIDRPWALLLAVAACASIGAAVASQWHRRQYDARRKEHSSDLKTWENEGGNVAPDAAE